MLNSNGGSFAKTYGSDRFYSPPGLRKSQRRQQRVLESDSAAPDLRTGDSHKSGLFQTSDMSNLDRLLVAFTPSFSAESSCEVLN